MPPGPFLQSVNARLHCEPLATISYAIYWSFALFLATPICVVVLLVRGIWKLLHYTSYRANSIYYDPSSYNVGATARQSYELAVFITGCDTGFGKEVALLAASKGFIVFACCLHTESFSQFTDVKNIKPLQLNVTKDEQVREAAQVVQDWIRTGEKEDKKRVLHAILNNAGIGIGGLVDWLDLAAFQKVMDVNYFGIVRVCHAFLPLLKDQAIHGTHVGARILNVVSMAGLVPGGSGLGTYGPSKFAATSFSTVLRAELKAFGIQVSTVNPSFHGTPLVHQMRNDMTRTWDNLSKDKRAEYGEAFFERFVKMAADIPQAFSWKMDPVVDAVLIALQSKHVEAQLILGMDARFAFVILRMLPWWLIDWLDSMDPRPIPAAMMHNR
ncbi:hypothetical protein MPSEU_000662700 [Mayamaea pseudoterrestris]|nr:hypothetical protein MPSEU_000662700 [Mayamaea pseudoterrestris]